jgi:hypothetical protein
MSKLAQVVCLPQAANGPHIAAPATAARALYFALNRERPARADVSQARAWLEQRLGEARRLPADLPADLEAMPAWIAAHAEHVGAQYRAYLTERQTGGPRRYFSGKAHALHFLKSVAPTKLVDGAWLYGLLARWDDTAFHPLIRTYLEELGDGVPDKNHVLLYKRLLAAHGCDQWRDLSEPHFVQGAIQLCLAHDAEHFLPELIGYNLGYEQLPLHLLITAYELNELGIDPYYFTLHVTVDNAATGHAHKAWEGLCALMPRVGDAGAFFRRVLDGYRLNDLGAGTVSVIRDFDLEAELIALLQAKAKTGANMHSDYCRVAGRTVNDWLAEPSRMPEFLRSLEQQGWIQRGAAPEHSRFWRLIQSERAEMFGVFSEYEQQILRDWIQRAPDGTSNDESDAPRVATYRAQQRTLDTLGLHTEPRAPRPARGIIRHRFAGDTAADGAGSELSLLEKQVAAMGSRDQAMSALRELMTPAGHHTNAGLMATRIFTKLLG